MRTALLALLLVPVLAMAELPVVALSPSAELIRSDGQPFGPRVSVVIDGDQIAVLDGTDQPSESTPSIVFVFSRQADGGWLQTAQFNPPGSTYGPIQDFDFQGNVTVVTRTRFVKDLDGTFNAVYVAERDGSVWRNAGNVPGFANGMVRVVGDDIAISTINGVALFHRSAPGVWTSSASLPMLGYVNVGDNILGPSFDFDGNRVLIVTNVGVYEAGSSVGYANVVGRLYERNADNSWSLKASLPTTWAFYDLFPFKASSRGLASLAGPDVSLIGNLYRGNTYGGWERTGDVVAASDFLSAIALSELRRSGVGLVERHDLYRRGADGLWHARLRIDGGVAAIGDHAAVYANAAAAGATPNRLFVADLDLADASLPVPATIAGLTVQPAAAVVGQSVTITANAYVHGRATIRKIEARDATGVWQPLAPVDGSYDDAFESAQGNLTVGPQVGRQSLCIRVTDSAGRISELLDTTAEPCPIVEALQAFPVQTNDNYPPSVDKPTLARDSAVQGQDNFVYSFASDSGYSCTGSEASVDQCVQTKIQAMQFRIDDGVWRSMKPFPGSSIADFSFRNAQYKAAQGELPPSLGVGAHVVCVRAIDTVGNVSLVDPDNRCTTLQVTN